MSPQEVSFKASPVRVLSFKAPPLKGLSLKGAELKSLKLPALSFRDMSLRGLCLKSPRMDAVQPGLSKAPAAMRRVSSQRTRFTVLSAALVAMAALATGGMVMGPPIEPVRMSGMNAVKAEGYPVFDRYGDSVGRIESVENAGGRTIWLNIKLEDGNLARVASFRGFLDARARQVDLVLTRDLIEQRGVDQANAAADQAAFEAALKGDDGASTPNARNPA